MITEAERYHGVVFRQLVVSAGRPVTFDVADSTGRKDCFRFDSAAFQIKYSTRRLSPWYFSFTVEQMWEIEGLVRQFYPVWMLLVCGVDGIVGISAQEFIGITESRPGNVASIRVSRKRNSMYRVSGNAGELPAAKSRGVDEFLNAVRSAKPLV